MRTLKLIWILVFIGITGCAYKASLQTPDVSNTLNSMENATTKIITEPSDSTVLLHQVHANTNWWQDYQSEELDLLIDELIQNNLDLATARQRVEQARAVLGIQRADDWPNVNTQLSHRRGYDDTGQNTRSSNLNFSAAYEFDLWGSRSAARYSAELGVVAQQQEYQSLLLILQSSLAQMYFDFISLIERQIIAEQNLQASKDLFDLIQLRFEAGNASGIELSQQRNTLLSAQASALTLKRQLDSSQRALSVLVGREDFSTPALARSQASIRLPTLSLVQPASLLESRPDIQLAESALRIAEASLYQQKKKRWPVLNLSAGLSLDEVFENTESWTGSLIGALGMPLFDGGRISQQINAAETELAIAEINYRQVVIRAMQETIDTLSELEYQKHILQVREQELENNDKLYNLARLRYESGDTDFINLLNAQRDWFGSRDNVIQAKNNQLQATVNVFKAMGIAPEISSFKEKVY